MSILASKLTAPPLPSPFIPRPRVVGAFGEAPGNLRLVSAPAGYGKTVAVLEAVFEEARDVAWLSVDAYDSSGLQFWAHLAASVDGVRPGVVSALDSQASPLGAFDGARMVTSLLAALDDGRELVIVLDDLHRLKSRPLWEQLAFFLERIPPLVQVVITTREHLPLPVERWRSQHRVAVIDERRLSFDIDEGAALLSALGIVELDDGTVTELVARSEGWAIGLLFEALATSAATCPAAAPRRRPTRPSRTVINYLTTEVLAALSPDDCEFLLSISVLDEFDNDLCCRVTGERDAGLRLRALRVANLFLVPVDADAGLFRFHQLFRDLLLDELDQRDPGRRTELHRRAAAAAGATGRIRAQINHLLGAGEPEAAFDVMLSHTLKAGCLTVAQDLIASFPTDFVVESPRRVLDYALVNGLAGDWRAAEQWCGRAQEMIVDEAGPLRARLEVQQAILLAGFGHADDALAAIDRSLRAHDERAPAVRSVDPVLARLPLLVGARVDILLGRDAELGRRWLSQKWLLDPDATVGMHITVPALTAAVLLLEGDLCGAEESIDRALSAGDQLEIPDGIPFLEALQVKADLLIETGRLVEAHATLDRAESLAAALGLPSHHVHNLLRRVDLTAAEHGPAAAADAAGSGRARISSERLGRVHVDALVAKHAYWLLAEGRTLEGARLAESLRPGPPRSILLARVAGLEHRANDVPGLLSDAAGWPAFERTEAELLLCAARHYHGLRAEADRSGQFVWSWVRQGPTMLRRLTDTGDSPDPVTRLLAAASVFNPAYLPASPSDRPDHLTDRERTLLRLLPTHLTYAGIGSELHVSVNTVKANLKSLYRKLGASSRAEAVRCAQDAGVC